MTVGGREAVTAGAAAVVIALAAGFWPAWLASRTTPAEALHYE